jgi:hypothetical protein
MNDIPDFFAGEKTTDGPRAWTTEETRSRFLAHVWHLVRYWGGHDGSNVEADRPKDRCLEGLAFSLLAAIDGSAMALPGFTLMPAPDESDEEYLKENGANWYPDDIDIAGGLHELFYPHKSVPEGEA